MLERLVPVEQRHAPDRLLDEEQQHVAQPGFVARLRATPQRGQRVSRPRQEQVVQVGEPFRREPRTVIHLIDGERVHRNLGRQREILDSFQIDQVVTIRGFPVTAQFGSARIDQNGLQPDAFPGLARRQVGAGDEGALQIVLRQQRRAVRAGEPIASAHALLVERFPKEHDLARALRAGEHLAPHGVVDPPGLAVGVVRLIHPADLRLHVVEQAPAGPVEGIDVEWRRVVGGDESGGG